MSGTTTTGQNAEKTILDHIVTVLTPNVYAYKDWVKAGSPSNCVVRRFPYTSIYGSDKANTEFVLIDPVGNRTRIEVKWQVVTGSVDEKFPYLLENALSWPEQSVIIVTGGGGAKPSAVDWLERNAVLRAFGTGKTITVFRSTDEFGAWAHKQRRFGAWKTS